MERLMADEIDHLAELLRLRGSIKDEYIAAFLDGIIRETQIRARLLDALRAPELAASNGELDVREVVQRLEEMCRHYESHLSLMKSLRASAKTPLELEVIASVEKSVERTHMSLRMLINALSEFAKPAR
ncbi:MAG: hypothetical protein ABWJ97_03270 [Thermoproteus sp.]